MITSGSKVISVRFKILGTLGLTLLVFVIGYFVFLKILSQKNEITQKIQDQELIESIDAVLSAKNDAFDKQIFDYTIFSWMVDFIKHPDKRTGMQTISHPQNIGVDYILVYNLNRRLVYSEFSPDIKDSITISPAIFDSLYAIKKLNFFVRAKEGLVQFFGGTVHPSDDTERKTPPQGYVLFGKLWDPDYISSLEKVTNSHIALSFGHKMSDNKTGKEIELVMKGFGREPIAYLHVFKTNLFLANLRMINKYFDVFFISFCLVLFVIIFITYNTLVIMPLHRIEAALTRGKIDAIEKLSQKNDEFGKVARLIRSSFDQNHVLSTKVTELHSAHESMQHLNLELSNQKSEIEAQYAQLHSLTKEVQAQNEELFAVTNGMQLANKEITDSISYASIIQKAVLAPSYELSRIFMEHFIIYRPKNIVSGDFYWFKEMENGDAILAVADCTGHGLSGSLLSMLGISFLNQIMYQLDGEEYTAASILNSLKEFFIGTLHQKGGLEYVQDGMHIALCIFDRHYRTMQYATAFHTICLVRKNSETGEPELTEYKGNRIPVGIYITDEKFTNYTVKLEKDDAIYMYSDGITDQFGGPNNKKFMPSRVRNLITSLSQQPLSDQKEAILREFEAWQGTLEQTDDVILVGIRVP